jgi:hypothetical protein
MRYKKVVLLLLVIALCFCCIETLYGQEINISLGKANVMTSGECIEVNTGLVKRVWRKAAIGLQTISIKEVKTGKEWVNAKPVSCDWEYLNLVSAQSMAKLVLLNAVISNDSAFTSKHIEFTAEYYYPVIEVFIKFQVRVYPGSSGIFTQLSFKGDISKHGAYAGNGATGRVEFLPVNAKNYKRTYFGYYNDTQHRNTDSTPIIREEKRTGSLKTEEQVDWSSGMILEKDNYGLIVVKESHKCVNQPGHDTGSFLCSEAGISNTGTSLLPGEILSDRYRKAWASWVILYHGDEDNKELALKSFERFRFPVNLSTDVYMIANTWGSDRGRNAATEENVLKEMAIQKSLGIDVQQIDDGYQMLYGTRGFDPGLHGWYPVREKFRNGFLPISQKAQQYGMRLGLWFASMKVSLEEMKRNYDTAGFSYYKLDFALLNNHDKLEMMQQKIRAFELYSGHRAKVNWDVTENSPRFGYFWAKEYGCVFLENRKPLSPKNVIYTPYLVLRDLWQLAKYCNLNKFQGVIQNVDRVDTSLSDAYLYNHQYCVGIPLMSTPLFFQETQFYSDTARQQVKAVIDAYKGVRHEMYKCIVYPIGSIPDNKSWSGFQAHHSSDKTGFLTIFRELNNLNPEREIQLRFLKEKEIRFMDMLTKKEILVCSDKEGFVKLLIDQPAAFKFFQYWYK